MLQALAAVAGQLHAVALPFEQELQPLGLRAAILGD
jgi:hypothetical protein